MYQYLILRQIGKFAPLCRCSVVDTHPNLSFAFSVSCIFILHFSFMINGRESWHFIFGTIDQHVSKDLNCGGQSSDMGRVLNVRKSNILRRWEVLFIYELVVTSAVCLRPNLLFAFSVWRVSVLHFSFMTEDMINRRESWHFIFGTIDQDVSKVFNCRGQYGSSNMGRILNVGKSKIGQRCSLSVNVATKCSIVVFFLYLSRRISTYH